MTAARFVSKMTHFQYKWKRIPGTIASIVSVNIILAGDTDIHILVSYAL